MAHDNAKTAYVAHKEKSLNMWRKKCTIMFAHVLAYTQGTFLLETLWRQEGQ